MYDSNWKPEYPGDKLPLLEIGTCHAVDFCVWVLQVDGLRASPFLNHNGGDCSLQAAGLTADAWHRWLGRIIEAEVQYKTRVYRLFEGHSTSANSLLTPADVRKAMLREADEHRRPVEVCDGGPAVAARLRQLAPLFKESSEWQVGREHAVRTPSAADVVKQRERWMAIEPYLRRIGRMHVFPAVYPTATYLTFPPVATLVTTSSGDPHSDEAASMILAAARELASVSDAGRTG